MTIWYCHDITVGFITLLVWAYGQSFRHHLIFALFDWFTSLWLYCNFPIINISFDYFADAPLFDSRHTYKIADFLYSSSTLGASRAYYDLFHIIWYRFLYWPFLGLAYYFIRIFILISYWYISHIWLYWYLHIISDINYDIYCLSIAYI